MNAIDHIKEKVSVNSISKGCESMGSPRYLLRHVGSRNANNRITATVSADSTTCASGAEHRWALLSGAKEIGLVSLRVANSLSERAGCALRIMTSSGVALLNFGREQVHVVENDMVMTLNIKSANVFKRNDDYMDTENFFPPSLPGKASYARFVVSGWQAI